MRYKDFLNDISNLLHEVGQDMLELLPASKRAQAEAHITESNSDDCAYVAEGMAARLEEQATEIGIPLGNLDDVEVPALLVHEEIGYLRDVLISLGKEAQVGLSEVQARQVVENVVIKYLAKWERLYKSSEWQEAAEGTMSQILRRLVSEDPLTFLELMEAFEQGESDDEDEGDLNLRPPPDDAY